MNHNSYLSANQSKNNNHVNDSYNQWQGAMKDVEFKGAQNYSMDKPNPVLPVKPNVIPAAPEIQGKSPNKFYTFFNNIKEGIKDQIKKKLGVSSSEKIKEMTNDALVYIAKETIATADQDGIRTEEENTNIKDAVSAVVLQGTLEEAGIEEHSKNNPILELTGESTQSDLIASIEDFKKEDVNLENGDSVADLAVKVIEKAKKWDLKKIGDQLGSNEGGWYENPDGERFYVKFYKNPNQGRAEFTANAIYQKLGIKSVRSEIIQLDGREAIASPAVVGAGLASLEDQKNSYDVQQGFVADAFLANWDVVGLSYDNIVKNKDGLYRIDNGGSLIFRAQGGDKIYSPDSIPELQSMRVAGRSTGAVFADITEQEISRQARDLIAKIAPDDIRNIVDESGLDGSDKDRILSGLIGRYEFLVKTYGHSEENYLKTPESKENKPIKSISETIKLVNSLEIERTNEIALRPRAEIICDRDHIEGQRIDIINKKDLGVTEFRLKLRSPTEAMNDIIAKIKDAEKNGQTEVIESGGAVLKRDKISYASASSNESYILCDAFSLKKDGVKVYIADPTSRSGVSVGFHNYNSSHLVRTAMGLVIIETKHDADPKATEQALKEVLEKDLGIPNGLSEVSEEAERGHKISRYRWQHKITEELTTEQIEEAEKLDREEVFPGYTTLVERGKHKEYLAKYGEDARAVHKLGAGGTQSIYRVLTQGLMCTTERYSRGVMRKGQSSYADIETGGADSVFTRIFSESQIQTSIGSMIVFRPEIFDRTDWYSYNSDHYGSTDDPVFSGRLSPDAIFGSRLKSDGVSPYSLVNEQMFRTGIGPNFIESIRVNESILDDIITELKSMGLEKVGERPIEKVIVPRNFDIYQKTKQSEETNKSKEQSLKYLQMEADKLKQKQSKIQSIINGDVPYGSIEEIFDLGGDDMSLVKTMFESVSTNDNKDQIAAELHQFIKDESNEEELYEFAVSEASGFDEADKYDAILKYLKEKFGISYNKIYKEFLSDKSNGVDKSST